VVSTIGDHENVFCDFGHCHCMIVEWFISVHCNCLYWESGRDHNQYLVVFVSGNVVMSVTGSGALNC
jgi:hypothetical protein